MALPRNDSNFLFRLQRYSLQEIFYLVHDLLHELSITDYLIIVFDYIKNIKILRKFMIQKFS